MHLRLLLLLGLGTGVHAQGVPPLALDRPSPPIAAHFETYAGPGTASFDTVRAAAPDAFAPAPEGLPVRRGERVQAWGRVVVQAPPDRATSWLLALPAHEATVYLPRPDGSVDTLRTGWHLPLGARDVRRGRPALVAIDLPASVVQPVYIHVTYDGRRYNPPLHPVLPRLEEASTTHERLQRHDYVQGLFFGVLLALALYNLFLFATFGDRSYLYYIGFIVASTLFWVTREGYDIDFVWPADVMRPYEINSVLLVLMAVLYLQFARHFLVTRRHTPRTDRVMVGLMVGWTAELVLGFGGNWPVGQRLGALLGLTTATVVFAAGIGAWRAGFRPARMYLLAAAVLLLSCCAFSLRWFGLPDSAFIRYSFQFGMAAEALLLAMALVNRVRTLRHAQTLALEEKREAEHSNRALQEADAFRTRLIGIAAHDLRSPLTGILGFAEIIEDEAPEGSEFREFASVIQRDARRMLGLVNDLLETSALESGRIELARTTVGLGALVADVAEAYRLPALQKSQHLYVHDATGDTGFVSADTDRLRDALANLISNAVKYTPLGGTIEVSVTARPDAVRFAVRDTGPGLTEEDRAHLFQHFQRLSAQPTGGESSTGLGLAIARQLVELHGGRIGAEGAPGEGSTFWVELPPAEAFAELEAYRP